MVRARQQVHAVLVPQDVSRPLVQVYVHEEAGSWLKDALGKIQASEDEVRTRVCLASVCAQPLYFRRAHSADAAPYRSS